jgi:hypothetical protein
MCPTFSYHKSKECNARAVFLWGNGGFRILVVDRSKRESKSQYEREKEFLVQIPETERILSLFLSGYLTLYLNVA